MAAEASFSTPYLQHLDPSQPHNFELPSKKINEGNDVSTFLTSLAYRDIMTFILQLNRAMVPSKITEDGSQHVQTWPLNCDAVEFSEPVRRLQLLLSKIDSIIDEVPPDTGPRRFGNVSFRKWWEEVERRAPELMDECLQPEVLRQGAQGPDSVSAKEELTTYFLGSFGSQQRLDYGTGHELSFVAFLGCLWKLNGFPKAGAGVEERGIVLGVIEPYLELTRRLIRTYTLEPAGSHGVWGLDDHSFLPYILGSAQLSPPISESDLTPTEGSLQNSPEPATVAKANIVEKERKNNMYFSAIGFIYDVKRGPFWEHSPMLYDISGIRDGWGKINKGMIKMYNAEVLSKFPVVQHFPFGSLFRWEHDPTAVTVPPSVHLSNRPERSGEMASPPPINPATRGFQGTKAPWANPAGGMGGGVGSTAPGMSAPFAAAQLGTRPLRAPPTAMTTAPWSSNRDREAAGQFSAPNSQAPTKTPWAGASGGQDAGSEHPI
ncbi:serine/threonine-protein phosphatase 2A activator 1 [Blastomyces dermatitidis ER-3]|uniref:Serine/threonine-protein phosphatase 2A activator n=2 Tax=Blastomyces TaxID=229219 RepID=A0A179UF19_BLAGS|nr:serine/threonine-protein phosphatase 2A activator 1 [Blastomyces gilchristii SLH14081]XP_045275504.1 serine/threonine-protein phosphatase 2A activator 1 [Blastomyces dermatitidis ER-3]EEQ88358.1 serine/threonine-protein phosphatase 2A activator 1 [Blastomyces dermatitidis ER-3]OAT05747.1 serine/threonine-protein phosphatase 2A activator 1 [Blastomyces gilchristii SLH14081]